jgi:predicted acylesterase/phospholipase RssA
LLSGPGEPVARRALLLTHEGGTGTLSGTGSWLAGRDLSYHLHLRSGVPADLARIARVLAGEALGLVLGGGAARGFAHIGAYRALVEAGVPIDWVGGASIGAVMGAPIAQGLSPEEVVSTARLAFVKGKPFGDVTLPVLSLLRGRRMERLIAEHLAGDIEDLPVPFFCVSSNLGQGTPHIHTRGRLVTALRASVSLPGVFPPAVVDGQLAIDGGILDNLPVDVMLRQPVGKVIAVDLTSRQSYEVEYDAAPSPWAVLAGRFLPFAKRHRVPSFMSLMLKATEIGTMAAVRASGERADLLLRPPVSGFSLTDVLSFDRIVEAGYQYTRQALEDWPSG